MTEFGISMVIVAGVVGYFVGSVIGGRMQTIEYRRAIESYQNAIERYKELVAELRNGE